MVYSIRRGQRPAAPYCHQSNPEAQRCAPSRRPNGREMKNVPGNDNCRCCEGRHRVEVFAQHGGDFAYQNITNQPAAYTRQHSE